MFKFDMQLNQNYASFYHPETGKAVFVDSFDNEEFDIRIGTYAKVSMLLLYVHPMMMN